MSFINSPEGNVYSLSRIGGGKALDSGFVLLGTGTGNDRVLEYIEAPTAVAVAWRNALSQALVNARSDRPVQQIDWIGLAVGADADWTKQWAETQGLPIPAAGHKAEGVGPKRRDPNDKSL